MIPQAWRRGEVAVIGLGRSGAAAARWLAARGVRAYASDAAATPGVESRAADLRRRGVSVDVGGHDVERIRRAVAVVVSPGVPPDVPALAAAREAGVEVVAELDLAVRALGDVRLIAVTGTNGKTTTTALVAQLLAAGGVRAAAAGNIGRPLIELADAPEAYDWIAVETSSFQLHDAPHLAPAIGVLTNLAPDHLDRYADVDAYYADKRLLFRNATERSVWVLNADDAGVLALAGAAPGRRRLFGLARPADAWLDPTTGMLVLDGEPLVARDALRLLGDHNVANAIAACLAAQAAGVGRGVLAEGLALFEPLPHRLEPVREVNGVLWINDSKATNAASTRVALRAMTRSFVLILGGRPKGERSAGLRTELGRCCAVVAYGEARQHIAADLGDVVPVHAEEAFDAAVQRAAALAQPGWAVLLSPACASYDQFASYEDRGARFRTLAEAL